jgi:hypothetical protein
VCHDGGEIFCKLGYFSLMHASSLNNSKMKIAPVVLELCMRNVSICARKIC